MKVRRALFYSVIFSVLLHAGFVMMAKHVKVKGAGDGVSSPKPFRVKITPKGDRQNISAKDQGEIPESVKFEAPEKPETIKSFLEQERNSVEKKETKLRKENINKPVDIAKKRKDDFLREEERRLSASKEAGQREVQPSFLKVSDLPGGMTVAVPATSEGDMDVRRNFFQEELGEDVDAGPGLVERPLYENRVHFLDSEAAQVDAQEGYGSLEGALLDFLTVYTDPETGQKYYRISVSVEERGEPLETLPKEILFLIDASKSIQQERLDEFKEGLTYALQHLNPNDRFNMMVFKEKISKFRDSAVPPKDKTIREALRFIDDIRAGSKTDTYNALYQSINLEGPFQPSYILLLSDGFPTQGLTDSSRLIQDISRVNEGKVSIFAFSGGVGYSRYLLDFISYKNRGWAEYSDRMHLIGEKLSRMYDRVRNPILINLRYHVSGLDEEEMFPKMLPDFFRNAVFTIYGTFSDEDQFVLQLLGDTADETREFVIQGALSDAKVGDQSIARAWAYNKIYYLVSQLEHDAGNQEILAQIQYLSKKFDIDVPYLNQIGQ